MNPSSQIKQQLKDKLKFDSYKKEETLIESKESISLLDSILTPSKPTPKTISILSLLENTKKKNIIILVIIHFIIIPLIF